ncbi:MAG TPA: Hsp33 family molecular chaperone HslO [Novosphingobium sp.]|nr:Hsp33 family molecular chaperone HslO [Novosphingobium sp.]
MSADQPAEPHSPEGLLAFTLADRNARGRVVRLGPVLREILSAHAYPPVLARLLAEALTVTALMGSLLKDDDGQLTMQAQSTEGPISLLVCDYRQGELRGYVQHDEEALAALGPAPAIADLFGSGYLAITFDLAVSGQRYQGIVPLEGASLAAACESYFVQSEQVPTLIRVEVEQGEEGYVAGGLLMQHLPDGEEGRERLHVRLDHPEWQHVAIMAGSIRGAELVDQGLPLDWLVWRLFHEEREVRVLPQQALHRGCRCTLAHYEAILSQFPEAERAEMRNEAGEIVVDCAFCSRIFPIKV